MSIRSQSNIQAPVDVHVAALSAPGWKTRWQAAQTLGELGDPRAVKPLIETLEDSNQWVRIVTAEALGHIRDRKATQALIYGLDDSSIWVRRASVVALGQIGDIRAISPLVDRLLGPPDSEWPEELRDAIAKALGAIGEPAIQVLIDTLENPDLWISSAAARALGQIGDPRAIAPLSVLMKRKQGWVRSAVTHALAQIADARAVRAALTTDEAPRAFWKLMALKEIDQSTIHQLTAMLDDPDKRIRAQAAAVLSQLGEEHGAEPLVAAQGTTPQSVFESRDPHHTVAAKQVQPLAPENQPTLEGSNGISSLIAALHDPVAEVRMAAAEALGKIGDGSAIAALNQALRDPDSRVRAAAARSLGEIGRPAN